VRGAAAVALRHVSPPPRRLKRALGSAAPPQTLLRPRAWRFPHDGAALLSGGSGRHFTHLPTFCARSEMPFEFFCSELSTSEPQRQLASIQRMRVICLALGPEKTRKHLLTYLMGEMVSATPAPHGALRPTSSSGRPPWPRRPRCVPVDPSFRSTWSPPSISSLPQRPHRHPLSPPSRAPSVGPSSAPVSRATVCKIPPRPMCDRPRAGTPLPCRMHG
jgi:hypothetical protein